MTTHGDGSAGAEQLAHRLVDSPRSRATNPSSDNPARVRIGMPVRAAYGTKVATQRSEGEETMALTS